MTNSTDDSNERPLPQEKMAELVKAVELLVGERSEEARDRQEERDLRRFEIQTNKDIALASISAQKSDREAQMQRYGSLISTKYAYGLGALFMLLIFLGVAIYMGAGEMVSKLLITLVTLAVGGAGGYGYGKFETRKNSDGQLSD